MISEVVNALFITFVATEYHLSSASSRNSNESSSSSSWWKLSRATLIRVGIAVSVAVINILDRISGAAALANEVFQGVLHAPRALLCALAYLLALYVDCRRVLPSLTFQTFVGRHVRLAFCRVAPAYPILAVLISFVFMFVISFFEHMHLPVEWLNWPIYYGVLYGPFSVVYWQVKSRIVQDYYYSLPTTAAATASPVGCGGSVGSSTSSADKDNPTLVAAMKRRQQVVRF